MTKYGNFIRMKLEIHNSYIMNKEWMATHGLELAIKLNGCVRLSELNENVSVSGWMTG